MGEFTSDYMEGYKKYNIDEFIKNYDENRNKHDETPITFDDEEWLTYVDIPEYEVSNKGRIRNGRTGRIMRTTINQRGYETITISRNHKNQNMRVHRMVARTFHDDCNHEGLDVNHKDGNKLNNTADNLEWCTRKENIHHAVHTGLMDLEHRKIKVRIIETGEVFDSMTDCGKALGCDKSSVGSCIRGKSKTCMGYHLELV